MASRHCIMQVNHPTYRWSGMKLNVHVVRSTNSSDLCLPKDWVHMLACAHVGADCFPCVGFVLDRFTAIFDRVGSIFLCGFGDIQPVHTHAYPIEKPENNLRALFYICSFSVSYAETSGRRLRAVWRRSLRVVEGELTLNPNLNPFSDWKTGIKSHYYFFASKCLYQPWITPINAFICRGR